MGIGSVFGKKKKERRKREGKSLKMYNTLVNLHTKSFNDVNDRMMITILLSINRERDIERLNSLFLST